MTSIDNLNGLFNKTIAEYNKNKKKEDWLRKQVKELMNREGYKTIGDTEEETIYKKGGFGAIKISWRHGMT